MNAPPSAVRTGAAVTLLLTLCGACFDPATAASGTTATTRVVNGRREVVVRHSAGETVVRGIPRRVVALAPIPAESVVALGIVPVGTTWFSRPTAGQAYIDMPPYLERKLRGVPLVGARPDPNLERIVELRPDLIVGVDEHAGAVEVLSRAAPTILIGQASAPDDPERQPWRQALLVLGQVFDRADLARRRLAEYDELAARGRAILSEAIGGESVLLIRTLAKGIRVHGKAHATMGHLLYVDLGLTAPAAMPDDYEDVFIPMESLVDYDPDHILMIEGNAEMTRALVDGPIWSQLKAVREHHVHTVHLYWIRGHGWYGKMAMLDDAIRLLGGPRRATDRPG